MENFNKLIEYLIAIQNFAKDIHYTSKGKAFYSKHLLADRIQSNLNEFIDQLKEVCFLAAGKDPLPGGEYLSRATSLIPELTKEDKRNFILLENLIVNTLQHIETFEDLTKGEENLISAIAQDLQASLGLILQQIKE